MPHPCWAFMGEYVLPTTLREVPSLSTAGQIINNKAKYYLLSENTLYVCTNNTCSAGVGRTGTFICIDYVLEQIKKENVVDIAGAINKMRHQRMKMVQTPVSLLMIYHFLGCYCRQR